MSERVSFPLKRRWEPPLSLLLPFNGLEEGEQALGAPFLRVTNLSMAVVDHWKSLTEF